MVQRKIAWFQVAAITLFCLVCLVGWSGAQTSQAGDHASAMQDAGFKQWQVDTPKEQTYFKTVPTDQIVTYKRKDQTIHVYSDPTSKSVYFGDGAAYQGYLQKVKAQKMTPKPQQDAATPSDPEFWNMYEDSQGGG